MIRLRLAAFCAALVAYAAPVSGLAAQADSAARRQQRALDSLSAAVRALQERLDSLSRAGGAPSASAAGAGPSGGARAYMNTGFDAIVDVGTSTTRDVQHLQRGDHDPKTRGFTLPNVELTFDAAVDPYFKGFSALVFKIDPNGETNVEVEEAWAQTTSLPWNLQIKAGQFLGDFGRQNAQHPHAWSFVDQPLVLSQMFGADGLRGQSARLSWLLPTSWYTEAAVSVLNSNGETAFSFRSDESSEIHGGVPVERDVKSFADLVILPRISTSVDLTPTQTVVLGVSGATGPNNAGSDTRTTIGGVDLYYKWKPVRAPQGFPFVSWQTEALTRRYETGARASAGDPSTNLPAGTLEDWGAYTQLLWGIKPRIVAGLRGELVRNSTTAFTSEARVDRDRISPSFTWYPSEFSKIRLQYNYDNRDVLGRDHSLWLQFEFMMGAHAAHKF